MTADLREAVARWVFALNNPARLFDVLPGLADDARADADEVLALVRAEVTADVRREALQEAAQIARDLAGSPMSDEPYATLRRLADRRTT